MVAIGDLRAPPEVHQALRDGRRFGRWIRARCPFCDPEQRKSRSLAASDAGFGRDRDRPGWKCFRCNAEEHYRGNGISGPLRIPASPVQDDKRRQASALSIIDQACPIEPGDPVDTYLRRRKLEPMGATWPSSLRCAYLSHPSERERFPNRRHPAMVAIVADVSNVAVAVHRTFLTEDGQKANLDPVRLSLGSLRGAAVRLGRDSDTIVVAEGIETALAAGMYFGVVPWAALSTSGLIELALPRSVQQVRIAADRDHKPGRRGHRAGYKAALRLRSRIKDMQISQNRLIRVEIHTPPLGKSDFADL